MTSPYLLQDNRPLVDALLTRARVQRMWANCRGASETFRERSLALALAYETAANKAAQGVFPFDNDNRAGS